MGNLSLYVETARKRSRELRERFLTLDHGDGPEELIAGLTEAERGLFEERAGILELDGGLPREEAERAALREILTAGEHD
jgi:hypothetical protein